MALIPWQNWAGNQKCTPEETFHPTNLAEIKDIVKKAKKNNKKIRCAATGHSWSSLSVVDDYLVVVDKLNGISIDSDKNTVEIGPGVTIENLDKKLAEKSLTLPSNVVLTSVRYGGVISTGCHGAHINSMTISDFVVEMKIVTADGELTTFSESDPEGLRAAAVNLGLLGIIYTMTLRVQPMFNLRMKDSFISMKSIMDQPSKLRDLVRNPDLHSIEIFYWPFNGISPGGFPIFKKWSPQHDELWIKEWTVTENNSNHCNHPQTPARQILKAIPKVNTNGANQEVTTDFNEEEFRTVLEKVKGDHNNEDLMKFSEYIIHLGTKIFAGKSHELLSEAEFMENTVFSIINALETSSTNLNSDNPDYSDCDISDLIRANMAETLYRYTSKCCSPQTCRFIFAMIKKKARDIVLDAPHAIHYQKFIEYIYCKDMEFAIKVNKDFSNICEAWKFVWDLMCEYEKKWIYPLNITLEMRFVKSSRSLLSPAYDDDDQALYAMIEILSSIYSPAYEEFSRKVADHWITHYNARPHWAKMWEHVPNIVGHLQQNIGGQLSAFKKTMKSHDPDGIFFSNASLQQLFDGIE